MLKFFSRLEKTRGVVIISFAVLVVLGLVVAGYNRGGGSAAIANPFKSNEALAKVNGDEVTVADYSLLKKKIENQYSQFGGQISLAQLGMTPERILDQAINSRIAVQEARRLGLTASDEEVRDLITRQFSDPATGNFDVKNYKEYVTRNYGSVPLYEQSIRNALAAEKLRAFVTAGVQVSEEEVKENFLRGLELPPWPALNPAARHWLDTIANLRLHRQTRKTPLELFQEEKSKLKPVTALPYDTALVRPVPVNSRFRVIFETNRYSVPVSWIGRRVEVRETKDKVEIQLDARNLVTHSRMAEAEHQRITLAPHRPPRGQGLKRTDPHPEEQVILKAAPEMAGYVAALKQHSRKLVVLALRQLLRLLRDYPREPLLAAVREAARYGLYDLDRVERMILRRVARDYFLLKDSTGGDPEDQ